MADDTITGMRVSRKATVLAVAMVVVAATFIALGVAQGDALDTWRKAVRICFECIGIG
jgi:hypothetical protein